MAWRPEDWKPMFTESEIEDSPESIRLNLQVAFESGADAMFQAMLAKLWEVGSCLPKKKLERISISNPPEMGCLILLKCNEEGILWEQLGDLRTGKNPMRQV